MNVNDLDEFFKIPHFTVEFRLSPYHTDYTRIDIFTSIALWEAFNNNIYHNYGWDFNCLEY